MHFGFVWRNRAPCSGSKIHSRATPTHVPSRRHRPDSSAPKWFHYNCYPYFTLQSRDRILTNGSRRQCPTLRCSTPWLPNAKKIHTRQRRKRTDLSRNAKSETNPFARWINIYSQSLQSARLLTGYWYILDALVMIGAVSGKSSLENIACAHLKNNFM